MDAAVYAVGVFAAWYTQWGVWAVVGSVAVGGTLTGIGIAVSGKSSAAECPTPPPAVVEILDINQGDVYTGYTNVYQPNRTENPTLVLRSDRNIRLGIVHWQTGRPGMFVVSDRVPLSVDIGDSIFAPVVEAGRPLAVNIECLPYVVSNLKPVPKPRKEEVSLDANNAQQIAWFLGLDYRKAQAGLIEITETEVNIRIGFSEDAVFVPSDPNRNIANTVEQTVANITGTG